MVADSELAKQFKRHNIERMRDGLSPIPQQTEHVGKRISFELHHLHEIGKGGEVYNIDNIRVLTPRQHIKQHSKGGK